MANIQDGTYAVHVSSTSVRVSNAGNLMVVLDCAIDNSEVVLPYFSAIASADGSLMQRNIETLKKLFGWDGVDPYWFVDCLATVQGVPLEAVVKSDSFTGDDGKTHFSSKIKWLNQPRAAARSATSVMADRADVMKRFGSKLRAAAGVGKFNPASKSSASAASPAPAKAPTAPAKAPTAPSAPSKPTHDASACWTEFCNHVDPSLDETSRNNLWYSICDKVAPDQAEIERLGLWDNVYLEVQKHFSVKSDCPPF